MSRFELTPRAQSRVDEIYSYGLRQWGEERANEHIRGLFARFNDIAHNKIVSRPIPAEFSIDGYQKRYGRYVIYWRHLEPGVVGILTVLHDRMQHSDRLREDADSTDD